MPTTVNDIKKWLEDGKTKNATHMIVTCDTYDYEDYPRLVLPGQNINRVIEGINSQPMQKVMEVYNYEKDLSTQLKEKRSWNL